MVVRPSDLLHGNSSRISTDLVEIHPAKHFPHSTSAMGKAGLVALDYQDRDEGSFIRVREGAPRGGYATESRECKRQTWLPCDRPAGWQELRANGAVRRCPPSRASRRRFR